MTRSTRTVKRNVLPGFGFTMGFTLIYLSLVVLIPLSAIVIKLHGIEWDAFWKIVTAPRALAAYRLSFGASFIAALINLIFGFLVAWVLVRYDMPGKRIVDAAVDLPFALPTAVAGISLTALYSPNGWLGQLLKPLGIKVAYTSLGVIVALAFVGLPFVVRTLQPVLEDLDDSMEEAAASLGANRWEIVRRIIFPELVPAMITGFTLAFGRAIGEYGSVVFISGNMPLKTEIAPLLIMGKLEQFDYAGALSIALVMLVVSFVLLLFINWFNSRREPGHAG